MTFLLGAFADRMRERGLGDDAQHALFVVEPGSRLQLPRGAPVTDVRPDAGPFQPTPLATSVVGSHARPGWLDLAVAAQGRGELGPVDIREIQDDAVDAALRDQEDAGIDIVSDGEMRRAGFFTAEFYRHLTGVAPLPSDRRLGAGGHDQQHRFEVVEAIACARGTGCGGGVHGTPGRAHSDPSRSRCRGRSRCPDG